MSIPGLVANPIGQSLSGAIALSPLDSVLGFFNTNPYFIGLMMLFLNLGGRFLMMEVTKEQEQFFQNPWVRRFLIFVVLFVATRSLMIAFWLSIVAILILGYLFNENSALCIYNAGRLGSKCKSTDDKSGQPVGGLTPEEQEILRRLSEKNMRYSRGPTGTNNKEAEEDADHNEVYFANLELLQHRQ